ncbi:MAG TPA: fumarylacetoacetase [Jatrophihabitantaceae bacterium]|nr:fumarylacetoacetase [Jatrophihabitantaceae bacterium]
MTAPWVAGVAADHPFGVDNLPYGAAVIGGVPSVVVRIGDLALDLSSVGAALRPDLAPLVAGPVLNPLLATGPQIWRELRGALRSWLVDDAYRPAIEPHLHPLDQLSLRLPFAVGDYVDFYASEHHATNVGRLFRPDGEPLTPNWKHLPIGYHGRSGTIVVSPTGIGRPSGQVRGSEMPTFGPSQGLDFEAEVGFVLGAATSPGVPVRLDQAREHIFGVCLVNDWSARDIQSWETVPLGPFLAKSFATSLSPWVVPIEALDDARVAPPARDVALLPYLDDATSEPWGLDIELSVEINGAQITRPAFATMYWTAAQMLAHMTVNGASVRPGDLFASGTVSGPSPDQLGCLLELTRGGSVPLRLADGTERSWLADGDEVVIRGWVPATSGRPELGLGEVRGRIRPAH